MQTNTTVLYSLTLVGAGHWSFPLGINLSPRRGQRVTLNNATAVFNNHETVLQHWPTKPSGHGLDLLYLQYGRYHRFTLFTSYGRLDISNERALQALVIHLNQYMMHDSVWFPADSGGCVLKHQCLQSARRLSQMPLLPAAPPEWHASEFDANLFCVFSLKSVFSLNVFIVLKDGVIEVRDNKEADWSSRARLCRLAAAFCACNSPLAIDRVWQWKVP